MKSVLFPRETWETTFSEEAGFDRDRRDRIKTWLDERVEDRQYRFVLVKSGKLVVEWSYGIEGRQKIGVASTWKSMLANVLGIAVGEGRLPSADAPVYDYWPDFMDVPEGTGPKDGRYAFAKDRTLTFRQLIYV